MTADLKTCFVAAPIGPKGSDIRSRSDRVLDDIITPAVEPLGFRAIRLDRLETPGRLSCQAISRALTADIMVADLTGANPNVIYEVGIRHASGRPCVLMAEQGETNPFDLADIRTIFVDSSSAEGIATAVADLSRHVNATIPPVPIAPEVDELIRTLVLYEYLFDPLYSGPSGALTPPQLILTELRAANTKLSGESGLPRWTKLDFVREITSLIDLLRQRNLRPSRRGSQIADWPSAVPIAA